MAKIRRNDLCHCGSGRKYKECCFNKDAKIKRKNKIRNYHWSPGEIDDLSTDEIIRRLREFGVPFDEKEFLIQVKKFYSACDLARSWNDKYIITASGFDVDFIWMSCIILWERLAPDIINSEQIDELMQDGYDSLEKNDWVDACDKWLKAWKHLKERITPDMSDVDETDKIFSGLQSVANWCQDLEIELLNAGLEDQKYNYERIRYCEEFCNFFPKSSEIIMVNMKRAIADSYYKTGDIEKGEKTYRNLIKEYPTNIWGYIGWGDIYASGTRNKIIKPDHEKAKKIYRLALNKGMDDENVLYERLENLYCQVGTG